MDFLWRAKRLEKDLYSLEVFMSGQWKGTFDNDGKGITQRQRNDIAYRLNRKKGYFFIDGTAIMVRNVSCVTWLKFTPWNEDQL
jgi:hypothetical protein